MFFLLLSSLFAPMKYRFVLVLLFCSICYSAGAQELKDINYYLKHRDVSKAAKDYYTGNHVPGDDDVTYSIADSMGTLNEDTRPFYLYLVSKMLVYSGHRAVTEGLGIICKHYIQNQPNALITFLYSNSTLVLPEYRNAWARAIAHEITMSCDNDLMQCLKVSRALALERCDEDNKQRLEVIYNLARTELKNAEGE